MLKKDKAAAAAAKDNTKAASSTVAAKGVLGAYTKLKPIGHGQFGKVCLCRHTQRGGELLVMKVIPTESLSLKEVKATLQEVEVLKRVAHPSIIELRDAFGHESLNASDGSNVLGQVGIVTEYCEGGDLGSLIEKRVKSSSGRWYRTGDGSTPAPPLPESTIRKWTISLASALEYLHQTILLLHRDIKPSNIFLTADNDVKLGDFGLSKLLSNAKELAHSQVGTPLYMSPELCAGKPYDRGADVWAFGCTIYETMALQAPWGEHVQPNGTINGGLVGLYRLIQTSELDVDGLRKHFSDALCDVVKALVSRKRKVRLQPLSKVLEPLHARPSFPASWGLSDAAANALASMEAEEAARAATDQAFAALAAVERQYSIAHGLKPNSFSTKNTGGGGGGGGGTGGTTTPPSGGASRPTSRPTSTNPSPRSDPTSRSASRPSSRAASNTASPRPHQPPHPPPRGQAAAAAAKPQPSTAGATPTTTEQ